MRARRYLTADDDDHEPRDTLAMRTGLPGRKHPSRQGKNTVWTMVVLNADDQLRQRVAWARS